MRQESMFITFFFSNFMFALPVKDVMEIKKSFDITPVPLSPYYVEGIINLRGQIITAIHLAKKIGLKYDENRNNKYYHIIIKTSEGPVSLLVEGIGDVISISEKDMEPVPSHIEGIDTKYVKNISKLPDRLLIILDSEALQK